MRTLDWSIVALSFIVIAVIAVSTRRYVKGVSSFLAADRCAGRYLLTLADGMAGLSAIGIIGTFQQQYQAGFGASWWGGMMGPVLMIVTLTGFIVYRFRESRAMTMGQFFEMRYSRRFRVFAGILAWVAGILNYGVFPAVTARFVIYFCDLPVHMVQAGPLNLNLTLGAVMGVLLVTAVTVTLFGGQIAIMITDFLQAQFVNVVFLAILALLVVRFGWGDIVGTLKSSATPGKSMLNPFDQSEVPDFSFWFFAIGAFNAVYTYMAWQGNQGYNCSARTPHDAKMARVLSMWRFGVTWTVISLIPICAFVLMHSKGFTAEAGAATAAMNAITDESARRELTVALALKQILPSGMLGLFVAAMLACAISTDDAYLHSWGSIFIQDVVLPFRKRPFEPAQHLRVLRWSIVGVAAFAGVFGMLFPLREFIFMYWAITGAIFTGGAGAAIIGGFYWKRATAAGAWAGMITGTVLGFFGTLNNNVIWPQLVPVLKARYPGTAWIQALPKDFWLNGMEMFFFSCVAAVAAYVVASLATPQRPDFSMDRILHRGEYAIAGEHRVVDTGRKGVLQTLLGIDEEYTRGDRIIAWSIFAWTMYNFAAFLVGTLIGVVFKTTDDGWAIWWLWSNVLSILIGTGTVFWFLWCGFKDMGAMFRTLNTVTSDRKDDGTVRGAEN